MAMDGNFKQVAGAALAAGVVLSPMAASAADGKPSLFDIRKESKFVLDNAGGAASIKGRIALVVKGGDKELLTNLWRASAAAEREFKRDIVFIRAKDDKPNDKIVEVDIYIANQQTGTWKISDDNKTDLGLQLNALIDGGTKRIEALKTAPSGR